MKTLLQDSRRKIKSNRYSDYTYRALVFIVALALVIAGIAMLVLPGPGLLVIALGLAVAATEFSWAKRWLKSVRQKLKKIQHKKSSK